MAAPANDEDLLRLMLGGDAQAFEALYDRRQGGIYRYVLRMTGSPSSAEDITQEVFLSLIRDRSDYEPSRGSVKSYLYGMARFRLFRRLQRDRGFVSLDDQSADDINDFRSHHDPFAEVAREETVELVRQAVLSLPEHFREVMGSEIEPAERLFRDTYLAKLKTVMKPSDFADSYVHGAKLDLEEIVLLCTEE